MQYPWLSNVRGDVAGGLVSAIIAIPLAIGFGMFAFVALGDEFFGNGALAGLYTAAIVGVLCVVLGDKTTSVYAPRVITTFFIGLLLAKIVASDADVLRAGGTPLVLATIFSIILLGGAFQFLFGLVRLGTLIKFTPHPVMAGFQNAAAALLLLVQIGNVFGFERNTPFAKALVNVGEAKPLSIVVAAVTFAAMWNSRKLLPKVPPVLVGLAVGTALYYALALAGLQALLGPVLGSALSDSLGHVVLPKLADFAVGGQLLALWPTILGGALALALIASMDALLCAKLVARPGDPKVPSDALLMRLGAGNMAAAAFGGITSGFNIGASLAGRAFGARTPLSALVNALVLVVTIVALFPLIGYLPRVVLSAVIMVIAVQHFDPWTLRMLRRVAAGATGFDRRITVELAVVLLVATLSVTVDIVLAVFIGLVIAAILFLVRMGRSTIRRMYRCDTVRSRKSRIPERIAILENSGSTILVLELQGALFFGSAEKLAGDIDTALARQETHYLVLDLRRVTEIDSTGCQILLEINTALAAKDRKLVLAFAQQSETASQLAEGGVLDASHVAHVFHDVDRAIEWAEDDILRDVLSERIFTEEIPLDQVAVLDGFSAEDMAAMTAHLRRATYDKGSVVFREGEPGRELFIITKGTASAFLNQAGGGDIRLVTFAPGTVFGELAILDAGVRSASVIANDALVCYVLSEADFEALSRTRPLASIRLLVNLGRELSGRLRRANRTIHQLEV